MPISTCMNHPTKQATARCRRCGKPICNDCKLVSEVGVVCSEMCLDAIKSFQKRVGDEPPRRKHQWMQSAIVRLIMTLAILAAGVYGFFCWQAGEMITLSEFWAEVSSFIPFL